MQTPPPSVRPEPLRCSGCGRSPDRLIYHTDTAALLCERCDRAVRSRPFQPLVIPLETKS